MYKLKQSQTARPLLFLMVDSADHVSAKTGLTPTVTLSKNGASFASPAGAVSEVGSGWYKVAPNATDTATLGPLLLHATASSADPVDVVFEVIAYDPEDGASLGLSRLDAAVSTRLASASYTTPPTVVQVRQEMDSNSTKLANLDAAVSSRAAPGAAMTLSAAYDAAKTAASQTSVDTLTGYVDTEVAAIKAKTDNLPASPAATGDIPSAATVAGQVRTDLTTELGRIDAAISSRLASASYTAPDNAGIAAVKAKTDGLNFTGTDVKATLDGETVTPAAGSITAAVIATNAIDADALAADAVSELQAGLSTLDGAGVQSALTAQGYTTTRAGYLDTLNGLVAAIWAAATRTLTAFGFGVTVTTNADKSGYSLATAPPTAAEVADAVWDEAQSGHASAGTFGKYLDAQVSTVGGGSLTAAAIADAVWDEATSDHQTAGTTGKALTSASAAGDPWSASVRTLTQSAAQVAAAVQGSALAIRRGDTFSATLTGIDVSGTPKLYWTVKRDTGDADSAAVLQVDTATGLLTVNGAAYATSGHGAIVIASATSITLTLDEAATALLSPVTGLVYDVQKVVGGAVTTLTEGAASIVADVTRATT